MNAHPLTIALPGGVVAELIPGSRPARYTVDGEPTALDVTIPDDLAAAGWVWHGSFLAQPWPNASISISTGTFPPPGWPSDRQSCFDAAREIQRVRAEHTAALAARPVKPTKKAKPAPVVLVQAAMELTV